MISLKENCEVVNCLSEYKHNSRIVWKNQSMDGVVRDQGPCTYEFIEQGCKEFWKERAKWTRSKEFVIKDWKLAMLA